MEGKLGTDELANGLNRLRGGGSSGMNVSGEGTTTGVDGESWIVVTFNFSPGDIGAVVIRMTNCLMVFRAVFDF